MSRRDNALDGLNLEGLGLEIGPSYSPLAAGHPGLNVRVMDHLDQQGLIEKYGSLGQDTSVILPVDYVWDGHAYIDMVGEERFDWILASHVIEHMPDIVGFINECAEILRPGGVISLVVPDKRFTFDHLRMTSSLAGVIDAALTRRRIASAGTVVEALFHQSAQDSSISGEPTDFKHAADLMRYWLERPAPDHYVDVHMWAFTASSFRLLIEELWMLGLIKVRETRFAAPDGVEFFVQLSAEGAGPDVSRLTLNRNALMEAGPLPGSR